jgi:hypothetical protein
MDLNYFGNLDLHQNPHKIKIWIRIKYNQGLDLHQSDTLCPDPHQFEDDMTKCMEYENIWALLFQGFEPLFGS